MQDVEVSSAQQRAATILNFLPMFIIMAAFAGGMQIATDSTAGERERGSLEALLANPAPRGAIAAGKWLAATAMSFASVCLTMGLCVAMMKYIPLQELGMRFRLGPPEVLGMFAAAWPLCPLAAALQMSVSTFARSFKEAQSYMGFLMIIPVFPTVINTMNPITSKMWMYTDSHVQPERRADRCPRRQVAGADAAGVGGGDDRGDRDAPHAFHHQPAAPRKNHFRAIVFSSPPAFAKATAWQASPSAPAGVALDINHHIRIH